MRRPAVPRPSGDLLWRLLPASVLIALSSIVIATQVLQPHRRVIKASVVFLALIILLRFDMIYALYLFIILFPFPAGIVITTTNVLLITLVSLLWLTRSSQMGVRPIPRTEVDKVILLFIGAYALSFINVEHQVVKQVELFWRQLSAVALFYLMVNFVDDERKLEAITRVIAISIGIMALIGLLELFMPGKVLIPGWISLVGRQQEFGYRIQALRVGGAWGHNVLSDASTVGLFYMIYHFLRSRNLITKSLWAAIFITTFGVLLATANRGAFVALVLGIVYSLYVFRSRFNLVTVSVVAMGFIALLALGQVVLEKYTLAASITQRLTGTEFRGVTPDSRDGAWGPVIDECKNHIFIGHGPFFEIGTGLERLFWPHNGYLFFLYSIGVIGLVIFLGLAFKLFRISLRYRMPGALQTVSGSILAISHVQFLMLMFEQLRTDHQRNFDYVYIYVVWIVFGVVVAAERILRKKLAAATETVPEEPISRT